MKSASDFESKIESYLARVRVALRGMPEGEIEDILRELRSHAVELSRKEGQGIDETLESLGHPLELAKTYRTENQMMQAECSNSPLAILQGLRHASGTWPGRVTATALYLFGFINVGTLWAAALEKLFSPSRTGLWYVPGDIWSLSLVTTGYPPNEARELLGWWLVPLSLLAGAGVWYITIQIAQWWIARYRRRRGMREV